MAPGEDYGKTPITVTPPEVTRTRIYEGELNMFTENEFPLKIEIPAPRPGLYRYRVTLEWEGESR